MGKRDEPEVEGLPGFHIRPADRSDRDFLCEITPRLLMGYAAWRDPARMYTTMQGYLLENLELPEEKGAMFIAESDAGPLGVVSVSHNVNFTGERQAYIGELAVVEEAEGRGVGRALVRAVERWARDQDHDLIVLDTGAANTRARRFYADLGYQEESVRLVRVLEPEPA
jgi:GNAT superfamily N-acetyltransferase